MSLKMREEDRRAMDVLLDRSAVAAGKNGVPVYATTDENVRSRIVVVEKVLSLLDQVAAEEPPRHLLDRTLRFVEEASGRAVTLRHNAHPLSPSFHAAPPVA